MSQSEATHLLALAAGEIHKEAQRSMRIAAAEDLLRSIVDLASTPSFEAAGVKASIEMHEPLVVQVRFLQQISVELVYHGDVFSFFRKEHFSRSSEAAGEPLKMAFDPVARVFVSGEVDPWTSPTPGERTPQRSPAAKILEAALDAVGLKYENGAFQYDPGV